MEGQRSRELADAIRELAGLLGVAGQRDAAELLDDQAASLAAGVAPRGLAALRRANAIRVGLAVAAEVRDDKVDRTHLAALVDDIARAMAKN